MSKFRKERFCCVLKDASSRAVFGAMVITCLGASISARNGDVVHQPPAGSTNGTRRQVWINGPRKPLSKCHTKKGLVAPMLHEKTAWKINLEPKNWWFVVVDVSPCPFNPGISRFKILIFHIVSCQVDLNMRRSCSFFCRCFFAKCS